MTAQKLKIVSTLKSGPIAGGNKLDNALVAFRSAAGQIRPEHIQQVVATFSRIAEARIAIGMLDAQTTQRIRLMQSTMSHDLMRADKAADILREFKGMLTEAEQAEVAMSIIRVTLGLQG